MACSLARIAKNERKGKVYFMKRYYFIWSMMKHFELINFRSDRKTKPTQQEIDEQIKAFQKFMSFSRMKMTPQIHFDDIVIDHEMMNDTCFGQAMQRKILKLHKKTLNDKKYSVEHRIITALTIEVLHLHQTQIQGIRNLVCYFIINNNQNIAIINEIINNNTCKK